MKRIRIHLRALGIVLALTITGRAADPTPAASSAGAVTPAEARAIAKEAFIYGFPMVDNYRIQYAYFVDKQNPEHKGPFNQSLA